jgi:hypothetical protein
MFNWLKPKAPGPAVKKAEEDLERFLDRLRAADIDGIAVIAAAATHWRHVFADEGINLLKPAEAEAMLPTLLTVLERSILETRKTHPELANGLTVWLHTVRAGGVPEIRARAREMWGQLAWSFDHVEYQAQTLSMVGLKLNVNDPAHVPEGFQPRW